MSLTQIAGTTSGNIAAVDSTNHLLVTMGSGANGISVDAQNAMLVTTGGKSYQNCAAATAQSVKASPGRICKVIVLVVGTAAVTIYDNTAASGQAVLIIPASQAAGTVYDLQVPCGIGIFVGGTTNTPQLLVTYN